MFSVPPTRWITLLALLCMSQASQAGDTLDMLDVFNLEHIADPQISPDGQQVIYTRHFKDVMTDQNHSN